MKEPKIKKFRKLISIDINAANAIPISSGIVVSREVTPDSPD